MSQWKNLLAVSCVEDDGEWQCKFKEIDHRTHDGSHHVPEEHTRVVGETTVESIMVDGRTPTSSRVGADFLHESGNCQIEEDKLQCSGDIGGTIGLK